MANWVSAPTKKQKRQEMWVTATGEISNYSPEAEAEKRAKMLNPIPSKNLFPSADEMRKANLQNEAYKNDNPHLYSVMGGQKYEPVPSKNPTLLTDEGYAVVKEAQKADEAYRQGIKNGASQTESYLTSLMSEDERALLNSAKVKYLTKTDKGLPASLSREEYTVVIKYADLYAEFTGIKAESVDSTLARLNGDFENNENFQKSIEAKRKVQEDSKKYLDLLNMNESVKTKIDRTVKNIFVTPYDDPVISAKLKEKDIAEMTEAERNIYYRKKDVSELEADNFYKSVVPSIEARRIQSSITWAKNLGKNSNFWTRGAVSALSVLFSIGAAPEQLANIIRYNETGIMGYNESSLMSLGIRSGVTEKVNWKIGNWDAYDFIYNTTMSGVDSAVNTALFGPYASVTLGLSAAASQSNDILQRGGTAEQAFWGGLASGVFEGLFEKATIGNLKALKEANVDIPKTLFKNMAKSMVTNASEEFCTEVANIAYDIMMNGDVSNFNLSVEKYMKSGMSRKEAEEKAWVDLFLQAIEAGASGALMGIGFSGIAGTKSLITSNNKSYTKIGNNITNKNLTDKIFDLAESLDEKSVVKEFADQLKKSGEYTAADLGKLAVMVVTETKQSAVVDVKSALYSRFNEAGQSSDTANKNAVALASVLAGDNITAEQRKELLETSLPSEIYSEMFAENPQPWVQSLNESLKQYTDKLQTVSGAFDTETENQSLQNEADGGIIGNNQNNINGVNDNVENNTQEWGQAGNSQRGVRPLQENLGGYNDQGRADGLEQGGSESLRNSENRGNLTDSQKETLKGTAIKNEDGTPKAVYHFTNNMDFETFGKGDIGFHFGSEAQAISRGNILNKAGRVIKACLNIKNPLKISTDIMSWRPRSLAIKLFTDGILSAEQYHTISEMDSGEVDYNTPAAIELRRILSEQGYDGIVYPNMFEGDGESYIAFYPEQVVIVDDGKSNLQSSAKVGARESVDLGGIDTDKARHLNRAEQERIKEIGERLGRKVIYEDFYSLDKFKGKKKVPDGYIDENGDIHINFYAKRPIQFIFKHEITHYLKRSLASYQDFMDLVLGSKAFENWLHSRGYASIDELKAEITDTYSEVKGFNEEKCYDEILADFCAGYLFGGEKAVSQKLIDAMEPKKRRKFLDVMKDILAFLKGIFVKDELKVQIANIEDAFIKVYNKAVKVKADEQLVVDEQYAIYNHQGNLVEVDWDSDNFSSLSQQLKNHLEEVNNMQPVDSISFETTTGKKLYTQVFDAFKKFGFKVDVQKFGTVRLDKDEIDLAVKSYINTDAEAAALLSIPRVLKKGKIISGHQNHKNRGYPSITFAAPVKLNEKVGNVVVAVKVTGKTRYNAHRVLMPDGTEFVLDKEKDTKSQSARVTDKNVGQRSAKDFVPNNKLTQPELIVKNNSMQKNENYSIPTESATDLLDRYDKGEITREELIEKISRKKVLNPAEIANTKEEDADTTPSLKRKQGESKGDKTSNTYDSLLESDIFDDKFKDEVKLDSFIEKYKSVTNKETLKKAAKELNEGGRQRAQQWWTTDAEHASLIDVAMGFILMDRYQRIGDYESAVAVAERVREIGTASGQQVQIFSILGRLDPNSMAVYAQKDLSKAYETMVKGKTKAWISKNKERFKLTDSEIEFIRRKTMQAAQLPEGRDKAIRLAEIAALLQDKLPPQKGQALRALQRISLLLNPKTNIRNIVGNAGMVPVFIVSDFFGSGTDWAISKIFKTDVRTTGNFDIKSVKGFKTGIFETIDDFKRHINTRNQELNRFEIGQGKSFNENHNGKLAKQLNDCAKVLNALDRFTSFCLELGDRPFYELWFVNSINNQMKLNKVSEATPEMIAIASAEALQRTWQDTNKMVNAVSSFKNVFNGLNIGGYGLGDVMIKFTKTPANLTKAIVDFSPAGLVKSIAADGKALYDAVQTGQFEAQHQKRFVDSFSKGIVGTLLYVAAAALAKKGLLKGAGDDDDNVSNFEKYIQGIPEYSVKICGKWYSYEWMQPVGAIGAIVSDYMQNKDKAPDNEWYQNIWLALKTGGAVLYNQSFMQSIQNIFTADNILEGILDSVLDEPSAFVPQIFSQVSTSVDDYRRTAYEGDDAFKTALNNVKYKLPWERKELEKQVDVMGRDVPNSQYGIVEAFFNPANTFTDTSNNVTDEIYSLYKQSGNATVIPRKAPYYVTVKDNKINFSAKQRMDFQRDMGKTSSDILEKMFASDRYQDLSEAEKVDAVSSVYDYAVNVAKSRLDYDYNILSAMVGERKNGEPILTEKEYKELSSKARQILAEQYFMSKTETRLGDNAERIAQYLIKKAVQ